MKSKITNKGSASFRERRIFFSGLSTLVSKGGTLLVSIIQVPLILQHLGIERFGMIEILVSFSLIMNFADFGLGFGLQNRIPKLENEQNIDNLNKAVSTTFFTLVIISIFVSIIFFFFVLNSVHWGDVFNVRSVIAQSEAYYIMLVFGSIILLQLPFTIIEKMQIGFQEVYKIEMWKLLGQILSLVCVIYVVQQEMNAQFIVAAVYGPLAAVIILNFIYTLICTPELRPSIYSFDNSIFKLIVKEGTVFFALQILVIILLSSDRLIIAHLIGAEYVGIYSIYYRLSTLFFMPVSAFISPLLPAFNDADVKGDAFWIKKTLKRAASYTSFASVALALALYFSGALIIELWLGNEISTSRFTLLCFSCYIIYTNYNNILSNIMMIPKLISVKVYYYALGVIISIGLKYFLVDSIGMEGVVIATIIGMSLFYFLPSIRVIRKYGFI